MRVYSRWDSVWGQWAMWLCLSEVCDSVWGHTPCVWGCGPCGCGVLIYHVRCAMRVLLVRVRIKKKIFEILYKKLYELSQSSTLIFIMRKREREMGLPQISMKLKVLCPRTAHHPPR